METFTLDKHVEQLTQLYRGLYIPTTRKTI